MTLEVRLAHAFLERHPGEAARVLERLPLEQQIAVIRHAPADASGAVREMAAPAALDCLSELPPSDVTALLSGMPTGDAVELLRALPAAARERALEGLAPADRARLSRTLQFPSGTAGALLDPGVLTVADTLSAAAARLQIRRAPSRLLYYVYVVDREHRLVGVVDLPDLLRAPARDTVRALMRPRADALPAWLPAATVRAHPAWRTVHAMPVVDEQGRWLGAIRYETLRRLDVEADRRATAGHTVQTVVALGELFHLGVAGLVEGVAAAAVPREPGGLAAGTLPARHGSGR